MKFIEALESSLGLKAKKNFLPMQPGDVPDTFADVSDLINEFNYKPNTPIQVGVEKFVNWYRDYFNL